MPFGLRKSYLLPISASLRFSLLCLVLHFAHAQEPWSPAAGFYTLAGLTNTTASLSEHVGLQVTASRNPLPQSTIDLIAPNASVVFPNITPSIISSTYLKQITINSQPAVANRSVRVLPYAMGTILLPLNPNTRPLQVFDGPHLTGDSVQLEAYTIHGSSSLGPLYGRIQSLRLQRGYSVTLATNPDGTGASQCLVAQDADIELGLLPAMFVDSICFVRVFPWRWTAKKGIAGNIEQGLNVRWKYNWNLDQNSTTDLEYVPIRQTRWWPSLDQDWRMRGANTLLGFNEPDRPDQANLTVDEAIAAWPDLLRTGLRLGAPAVSDGGLNWLYSFMDAADAAGLRVDFVPVHYYRCVNPADPTAAANQMHTFLKDIHDRTGRPIWITEWNNGANWTSCGDPSFAQQDAAISAMVGMLEETPFVERYAPYNWVEEVRRLQWDDGSLTPAGTSYRDRSSALAYQQTAPDTGQLPYAEFRFNGETHDYSGAGHHALPSVPPRFSEGQSGLAIELDGIHDYLTLPPEMGSGNTFTFAAWVWWNGGPNNGQWQRIFDFGNDTTSYMFFTPSAASFQPRFAITTSGYNGEQRLNGRAFPLRRWTHVAVTLNRNLASLYINGSIVDSTTVSLRPSSFNPRNNYLGKSQFNADPLFNGKLDDVLISAQALRVDQIAALANDHPPDFTAPSFKLPPAYPGAPYATSIASLASDPDPEDNLSFRKLSGPAWASVTTDGLISGTPDTQSIGRTDLTLRVTDAAGRMAFSVLTIDVANDRLPQLLLIDHSEGSLRFGFAGVPGDTYSLQTSASLQPDALWTTLHSDVAGPEGVRTWEIPRPTNVVRRFYRVVTDLSLP